MSLSEQLDIVNIITGIPLVRPLYVIILVGPVETERPESKLALVNVIVCNVGPGRAVIPVSMNGRGTVIAVDVVEIIARDLRVVAVDPDSGSSADSRVRDGQARNPNAIPGNVEPLHLDVAVSVVCVGNIVGTVGCRSGCDPFRVIAGRAEHRVSREHIPDVNFYY